MEYFRVLKGHGSQLCPIAFDETRIVMGSLDTTAKVWVPEFGYDLLSHRCGQLTMYSGYLAALRGHSSSVGQLQLLPDTLLTEDSSGELRIWSRSEEHTV